METIKFKSFIEKREAFIKDPSDMQRWIFVAELIQHLMRFKGDDWIQINIAGNINIYRSECEGFYCVSTSCSDLEDYSKGDFGIDQDLNYSDFLEDIKSYIVETGKLLNQSESDDYKNVIKMIDNMIKKSRC